MHDYSIVTHFSFSVTFAAGDLPVSFAIMTWLHICCVWYLNTMGIDGNLHNAL